MSERPQRSANEMCAEAGLHAHDTRRQLFERLGKGQPLDFAAQRNLPVGVKADDMENILSDVEANRCQGGSGVLCSRFHGLLLLLLCGASLHRLPRRGKQPVHPISGASALKKIDTPRISRITQSSRKRCWHNNTVLTSQA